MRAFTIAFVLATGCSALVGFDRPAEQGAQCSDGVDNDGNGLRDCEEASCADVCLAACGEGSGADGSLLDPVSGHCYLAFATARPVLEANDRCMGLGGYLAVPDTGAEDATIRAVAPPGASLGLADFDSSPSYDFRQVTGDRPAQYQNFSAGQPDGVGDEPLCVSYDGAASTWQDNDCATPRPYVCEVTPRSCGDLVRQPDEGCDDGNALAGDGCATTCVDEDECAMGTDACHPDADCLNFPWNPGQPGYGCQCRQGFVGDGFACAVLPPTPVFQPRAPVTLAGLAGCTTDVPRRGRKIAVDPFGALYVVVRCGNSATVIVSVDAGATWSPPQNLAVNVDEVAVVGVAPGRAVVAMALANGEVIVRQTRDFGMTWHPPRPVFASVDLPPGISLATDGDSVLVGLHPSAGGYRVQRAGDPELFQFFGVDTTAVAFGDVLVDPQAPSQVYAVGDTSTLHVSVSTDGGATFGPDVMPGGTQQLSDWAIGGGFIYTAGQLNDVTRLPVAALATVQVSGGLVDAAGGERTIAVGGDGTAYVAYTGTVGVELVRWAAAQSVVDPPLLVEPMTDTPAIEVVGGALVAAVYHSLGDLRFTIIDPFPQ